MKAQLTNLADNLGELTVVYLWMACDSAVPMADEMHVVTIYELKERQLKLLLVHVV